MPVFLPLVLAACATAAPSLTSEKHDFAVDEDERRLLQRAASVDAELSGKGLILADESVAAYVQGVGKRVVPAAAAQVVSFNFRVLRDPIVNAFALPNGSIYVNVGLLARLENEAQLAEVLGHEAAHVVRRHGLEKRRTQRNTMIAANLANIVLGGLSIPNQAALVSLASHGREAEAEADRLGLKYLSEAGYPLAEVERLFIVTQEVKPRESIEGSIYSSHPDNQWRMAQAKETIAADRLALNAGASNGAERYAAIRSSVALEIVRLKLNIRQYRLAADYAEAALAQLPTSPWLHYYRGEAYRLMADDPMGAAREHAAINGVSLTRGLLAEYQRKKPELLAWAKQSFTQCLAADGQFAYAYRGLGLVAYAEGDKPAAQAALKNYLENAKDITDRRYIANILGRMDKP